MYEHFEFLTLTQLTQVLNVSLQVIDRGLVECGLRKRRQPTEKAKTDGFVTTVQMPGGETFFTWHRIKTMAALAERGIKPVSQQNDERIMEPDDLNLITEQPPALGPFELKRSGTIGLQFVDANGITRLHGTDEPFANQILKLVNQAHEKLGWWA